MCVRTQAHEDGLLRDQQNLIQPQHLADDALVAEDRAIRYADAHKGHRSGHFEGASEYGRTRDQCMAALFDAIGRAHGVTSVQVRDALVHRRTSVDLIVILSFAVFYGLVANRVARLIRGSVMVDAWWPRLAATVAASVVVSAAGVGLGETWSGAVEMIRVGTVHLSYRVDRIPWNHPAWTCSSSASCCSGCLPPVARS